MSTLYDEVRRVFPSAQLFGDFEIYQNKNGVQEFQKWNEAVLGRRKTLEELMAMPDGQRPVRGILTPVEARKVLRGAGLLVAFDEALAVREDGDDFWYELSIARDNAMLAEFFTAQELTSDQIDDLFRI